MGVKQRHKRSHTVLDGSPPKALQPPSQPATPLRRSLWGSRAPATPVADQEPPGPNPYTACDPFDVTMMRCASPRLATPAQSVWCQVLGRRHLQDDRSGAAGAA